MEISILVEQDRFETCFKICVRAGIEAGLVQHSTMILQVIYKLSRVKLHSAINIVKILNL